jgi:predicted Zn-dependent peptidase
MMDYRRELLPNGLRVIYAHLPGLHSAHAVLCLRMGPRFEPPDANGLTHFVEHMLFKGSERYPDPEALAREMDAIGGELNGATEPEHAEFFASCHHRHFLRGLELLAELVLRPRFDPAHVETERRVVLEEMHHYDDVLGVNVNDLTYDLMWPGQGHRFVCIGTAANVARFTAADLRRHYERHLAASNVALCVAGSFDERAVAAVLAEQFGRLPRGESAVCPPLEDRQAAARCLFRRGRTRRASVRLAHKACAYTDPRHYAVLIAAEILGGGVTSRLFARLREREGLVYDVSAGATLYSDCGWVDVATTTSPRHLEPALAATLEEIRRLADEGVDDAYLQVIKERAACQMEILEDSPPDVAEWFAVRDILFAPADLASPTTEAERLQGVTAAEVQAAVREVFVPACRSLVCVGPVGWARRRRLRTLAEE